MISETVTMMIPTFTVRERIAIRVSRPRCATGSLASLIFAS